jgi:hypothetical protein
MTRNFADFGTDQGINVLLICLVVYSSYESCFLQTCTRLFVITLPIIHSESVIGSKNYKGLFTRERQPKAPVIVCHLWSTSFTNI